MSALEASVVPATSLDPGLKYIVGVGASAGGLEALERFFEKMPTDTGMAFVVVQHLSPDFKSLMDELLSRRTSLPIHCVEEGMTVAANAIYLTPPRRDMALRQGKLHLSEQDPHQTPTLPINIFFQSLAEHSGSKAIGIILSGTGSDGSRGIQKISAAGGLVIAQSSHTAKFEGMPDSARETGVVDLSLDPEDIPTALVQYATSRDINDIAVQFETLPADEEGLAAILKLLREQHEMDFSHYKLNTVVRRTERRLQLNRERDVKSYLQRLESDPVELNALYQDLLVGVTRFFRDEDAFDRLGNEIDKTLARLEPKSEFRTWVAGCATGEEAYSIAILLDERIRASGKPIKPRVFATDVHKASLEYAAKGHYSHSSIRGISPDRLETYFVRSGNGYSVNKRLKQLLVFTPHNIINDPPVTQTDLISCRNLLIYLQPDAQQKALSLFHQGLNEQGLLFLGPSESAGELGDEFEAIERHWNIHRKRRNVSVQFDLRPIGLSAGRIARPSGLPEYATSQRRGIDQHLAEAYDTLLAEYMPPGLLIDHNNQLLHVFGDAGRYLRHSTGRTSKDILDSLDPRLKLAAVSAIRRAHITKKPIVLSDIPVGDQLLNLGIRPIINTRGNITDYLVTFNPRQTPKLPSPPQAETWIDIKRASDHEIQVLEGELRRAQENSQDLVEELESSNQELQATNEELIASNEELQSTNEELHSVNEELYSANDELQRKIQQLTNLSDDIENLLLSTKVHTLFLDPQLRIRRFTPGMARIFSLVEHDIGRSIETFHSRLSYADLLNNLERVLKAGGTIESDVQDDDGRWFLARILPYMTQHGSDGVVLTLTDIDGSRRAQMNLHRIIDLFPNVVVAIDERKAIQIVNQRTEMIFGYAAAEMIGKPIDLLLPNDAPNKHLLVSPADAKSRKSGDLQQFSVFHGRRKDGERFPVEIEFSSINTEKGPLTLASIHDVTARLATQRELARREKELRLVINNIPMLIAYIDSNRIYRYVNDFYCEKLGLPHDQIKNRYVQEIVDKETWLQKREHLDRVFAGHSVTAELLRTFPTDIPTRETWILAQYVPDMDENDLVRGCFLAMNDITQLKELVQNKQRQVEQRDLFLATLSHELRNPLGAVMAALRLLQSGISDPEQLKRTLAAIDRQANQMTALLDDLLDVARITKGKIELKRAPTRLSDVINESIESVSASFDRRHQKVEVDLGDRPCWIYGDAVRLRQIVINLLTNASRYSPEGQETSVVLEVHSSTNASSWGTAEIQVTDHGIGIPPEMQERIFEPFEQLGRTHNEASEGLGLGLSLSRRLAELHGGTVSVHSEGKGKGSTFSVRLPLMQPLLEIANENSPVAIQPPATAASIVLVEDNDDARDLLRELLQYEKYEVQAAADGPSGLDLILRLQPCVALIDVGLPGMSGHEVARAVRNAGMNTKLIAVTGYGQDTDREAALAAGFDEHITKPVNFERLLKLLERIVSTWVDSGNR